MELIATAAQLLLRYISLKHLIPPWKVTWAVFGAERLNVKERNSG